MPGCVCTAKFRVPRTAATHTRDQLQIQKAELKLLRYGSMRKPCAPA